MGSIEAVIVAVIFLIPGFMVHELDNRLYSKERGDDFEIEKVINALILCLVSVLVTIGILNIFNIENIKSIKDLTEKIGEFDFIFKYIAIVLISIPITEVIYVLYRKLMLKFVNVFYKLQGREIIEREQKNGWEFLFENKDININDYCVEIVKNGNIVVRGRVAGYSPGSAKKKDITFADTVEYNMHFEADKEAEDKMFNEIDYEYYDINNDLLIRLYKLDKFKAYIEEYWESMQA